MTKNYEDEVERIDVETVEVPVTEIEVVEKKSLWTKAKEKATEIGDMSLRDAGKKVLKVGGIVLAVGAAAIGASKVFGNSDDDECYDAEVVEITDDEGNVSEVVIEEI